MCCTWLALGVADVGENRDQEAAPKAAEVAAEGLRWHFIGQLQRNKARSVVTYAEHGALGGQRAAGDGPGRAGAARQADGAAGRAGAGESGR